MSGDPKTQPVDIRPLLQMAGVTEFKVRWPSRSDVLAIGTRIAADTADTRVYAALLENLCGLSPAIAGRVTLAHTAEVNALFMTAFRKMRSEMPSGDPRLAEKLPLILAGEVR